ncbi:MAG: Stealth CR1 domain-containing protein [Clostridia bacterium]|nr:Stealth CR1 domain-containing protein [Clostridia bacterium]
MKIDFVITWVDGSDIGWRKEKAKYDTSFNPDAGDDRYRDMGLLKYWFRAVEEYAPWVNKVHFVTWGHLPSWLNTECEKLNIVKHEDYIPQKYLPTFSSRPIELNLCRIKELSEHFVYFNDDMFLNAAVEKEFFFKKGLPCDYAYGENIFFASKKEMYAISQQNEINEVRKHCSYIKSFFIHPFKYVNIRYPLKNIVKNVLKLADVYKSFSDLHLPCPYLKSSMETAWERCGDVFADTTKNRFRTYTDVSQRIFRYMRLTEGRFYPVSKKSRGAFFRVENNNDILKAALENKNIKTICINDTPEQIDFKKAGNEIREAFEKKFPEKSAFEK